MITRNNYNQHNQNIRNQGQPWQWSSDIDAEIHQNLDSLDNTDIQQQNQINDIINNQLPQKQAQITDHENRLQSQQQGINNINNDLSGKQNQINDIINNQLPQKQNQIQGQDQRLNEAQQKIQLLESKLGTLETKVDNFNEDTIDRLGVKFRENSDELKSSMKYWLYWAITVFSIWLLGDIIIVSIYWNDDLVKLYKFIPANLLIFTLLYFIVSQYVYYKKLSFEYKNRAIVAESYIGILNTLSNVSESGKVVEIVADTLFSRNVTDQGNDLPLKDALHFAEKAIDRTKS